MTKLFPALLIVASLIALAPLTAQAQSPLTIPITGSGADGVVFNGTFTLTNFTLNAANQLVANGILAGTLTRGSNVLGTILTTVSFIVGGGSTATCQILHLELGPLDLNLLGLMVHLNRIVLDITAQSGPGNLLGNLLCAVANLLNPNAATVNALNAIINALRGLVPIV
jgi:hypothetical protein